MIEEKHSSTEHLSKGWLSLYFWFGLVVTLVSTCALTIRDMHSYQAMPWLQFLFVSCNVLAVLLLWNTIRAFKRLQPNAVASAQLFHVNNLIIGGMELWIGLDILNTQFIGSALGRLTMAVVWLLFLARSKQVKELFPVETRKVRWQEIVLFCLLCVTNVPLEKNNYALLTDSYATQTKVTEQDLKETLEALNKQCPKRYEGGTMLEQAFLKDSSVVFTYRLEDYSIRRLDADDIEWHYVVMRQCLERDMCIDKDTVQPEDEWMDQVFKAGFCFTYQYLDKNGQFMYHTTFSPIDYQKLCDIAKYYKRDSTNLDEVLAIRNEALPMSYIKFCSLSRIYDNLIDNCIVYDVELPKADKKEADELFPAAYLDDYVHDLLGSLCLDYVYYFAAKYQRDIKVNFHLPQQPDYAAVTITYDEYAEMLTSPEE